MKDTKRIDRRKRPDEDASDDTLTELMSSIQPYASCGIIRIQMKATSDIVQVTTSEFIFSLRVELP